VVDLYNRLWLGRDVQAGSSAVDQRHQVTVSRIATLLFGAAGTALACNVSRLGNLIEINNRLVNAFTGPLFGIYLLAMFSRGSRSEGVLAAGVTGAALSYYVAYHSSIGFLWPSTFGLAGTLIVGATAAALWPAPYDTPGRRLTWREVNERAVA
jgi:Na+(H+)/acetate symporter ActP